MNLPTSVSNVILCSEQLHIYRLRSDASGTNCEKVDLTSSEDGKPLYFPQRWNFASVYCTKEKVSVKRNYVLNMLSDVFWHKPHWEEHKYRATMVV